MKAIFAILALTGSIASANARFVCQPDSSQSWSQTTIDTTPSDDTVGQVVISFLDGSELAVPLLEVNGDSNGFSAAGRTGPQRIQLTVSRQACLIDGRGLPYSLRMQRNGEAFRGCCE